MTKTNKMPNESVFDLFNDSLRACWYQPPKVLIFLLALCISLVTCLILLAPPFVPSGDYFAFANLILAVASPILLLTRRGLNLVDSIVLFSIGYFGCFVNVLYHNSNHWPADQHKDSAPFLLLGATNLATVFLARWAHQRFDDCIVKQVFLERRKEAKANKAAMLASHRKSKLTGDLLDEKLPG